MMFSVRWYPPCAPWLISIITTEARRRKRKTAPPGSKGWNGHVWLFLPSTVLTVSGSRGLLKNFELRIANSEFSQSAFDFNSQLAIRISQFLLDSQPRSLADRSSPETYLIFNLSKRF